VLVVSELIKHNPICKDASPNDYDCEECSRVDDAGQAECCMQPCNYISTCNKVCIKKWKYDEMNKFETKRLLERLQDYLLSKDDVIPFSFDILHDRTLANEKENADLKRKNAELQAQCAAIRGALENLLEKIEDGDDCFEDVECMNGFLGKTIPPNCMEMVEAYKALSTTAGADMLKRIRELEEQSCACKCAGRVAALVKDGER